MDVQEKAATLRKHFHTLAADFVTDGQPALGDQVLDAMKDMPDDTMARLHDIFMKSIARDGEAETRQ